MLKVFNIHVKNHVFGRSQRFDFPISGASERIVGAFATAILDDDSNLESDPFDKSNRIMKVSLSSDGDAILPSIPVLFSPIPVLFSGAFPAKTTANQMMIPVDYDRLGNKLTIVSEEFLDSFADGNQVDEDGNFTGRLGYTLKVYIKTIKR